MLRSALVLLFALLLEPIALPAQECHVLALPNREQLSSERVLHVIQDREGYLWYGTDGGGLCRDDGREVMVFRSDAARPRLLGSNNVVCLAEAGRNIIIGTTHGANVLDKTDYSIRPLEAVDDKRVNDIIVTTDGHWWLTANKKLYEYAPDGRLLRVLTTGDKYIFRLDTDRSGRIVCRQWEGGTLLLRGSELVAVAGEWPDSVDFRRIATDNNGRQLVSNGFGECHALTIGRQQSWDAGPVLTRKQGDSLRTAMQLSARPTAIAARGDGDVWFSTGRDIRRKHRDGHESTVSRTTDVSAMAFDSRGTLWLATIYGHVYRLDDGIVRLDRYASNEHSDCVVAMRTDSAGRIVMLYDRYVRIYDPARRTLRQQSREAEGTYMIELQETPRGQRWSQPAPDAVAERLPLWARLALGALLAVALVLTIYVLMLRRQRHRFMRQMRSHIGKDAPSEPQTAASEPPTTAADNQWLARAIDKVEQHLSDERYTVEQLSADMCMSRMTFYRKIQSATGHTPTEFMRTIRLRRAAEMLREGQKSVTEISYATGFSSVSYFSRCFRAMFGVPPTQFGAGEKGKGE